MVGILNLTNLSADPGNECRLFEAIGKIITISFSACSLIYLAYFILVLAALKIQNIYVNFYTGWT